MLSWLQQWLQAGNLPFSPAALLDCFTAWIRLGCLYDVPLSQSRPLLDAVLVNAVSPSAGKAMPTLLPKQLCELRLSNGFAGCWLLDDMDVQNLVIQQQALSRPSLSRLQLMQPQCCLQQSRGFQMLLSRYGSAGRLSSLGPLASNGTPCLQLR